MSRMLHGDPKQRPKTAYVVGSVAWRAADAVFLGNLISACVDAFNAVHDSPTMTEAEKEATPAYKLQAALMSPRVFVRGQSVSSWILSGKRLSVSGHGGDG